jgi:hypothetical protein
VLLPNAATLEQQLAIPEVQTHAAFYQLSSKGEPNTHIYFIYDRVCTYSEHSMILETLNLILSNNLGKDKKPFDCAVEDNSSNLCYAGKTDCVLIERADYEPIYGEPLNVNFWLEMAREDFGVKSPEEKNAEKAAAKTRKKEEKLETNILSTDSTRGHRI